MSLNTFVTHPSVRIKGTENNFIPTPCHDPLCEKLLSGNHLHCPFCVKSEFYQDPVILKAHYRVKHVDKGIDFAGLKILRCCDHCNIVGVIKGEKKYKGAHWHCYKCKNGFNRKDEAIKHYKTHFRNPQTSFQIQIAQEVTSSQTVYTDDSVQTSVDQSSMATVTHPNFAEAAVVQNITTEAGLLNAEQHMITSKLSEETVHVPVGANETVNTSEAQTHHIMIIQEDQLDSTGSFAAQIIATEDLQLSERREQNPFEAKYEELQSRYQLLQQEKQGTEEKLKLEIEQLKTQVKILESSVKMYQKKDQEAISANDKSVQKLMKQLEIQHRELLQQQLQALCRQYKAPVILTSPLIKQGQSLQVVKSCQNVSENYIIQINSTDGEKEQGEDKCIDGEEQVLEAQVDSVDMIRLGAEDLISAEKCALEETELEIDSDNNHLVREKGMKEDSGMINDSAGKPSDEYQEDNTNYSCVVTQSEDILNIVKSQEKVDDCSVYTSVQEESMTPIENSFRVHDNHIISQGIVTNFEIKNEQEPPSKKSKTC